MNWKTGLISIAALLIGCSGASAQIAVDFRIVPRIGHVPVDPSFEAILDFAVQARVVSAGNTYGMSTFAFNIRMPGEVESAGLLRKASTSLSDGTYDPGISTLSSVERGGLARQYTYLAQLSSAFNGSINVSSGSFVNTPDQEIGLITGAIGGNRLVITPGVDTDDDGNPDSVPLPGSIMGDYFAAGKYVDVYRFRYFVNQLTSRTLNFQIDSLSSVQVFSTVQNAGGQWTTLNTSPTSTSVTNLEFRMIPAPAAGLALLGAISVLRRRRA